MLHPGQVDGAVASMVFRWSWWCSPVEVGIRSRHLTFKGYQASLNANVSWQKTRKTWWSQGCRPAKHRQIGEWIANAFANVCQVDFTTDWVKVKSCKPDLTEPRSQNWLKLPGISAVLGDGLLSKNYSPSAVRRQKIRYYSTEDSNAGRCIRIRCRLTLIRMRRQYYWRRPSQRRLVWKVIWLGRVNVVQKRWQLVNGEVNIPNGKYRPLVRSGYPRREDLMNGPVDQLICRSKRFVIQKIHKIMIAGVQVTGPANEPLFRYFRTEHASSKCFVIPTARARYRQWNKWWPWPPHW